MRKLERMNVLCQRLDRETIDNILNALAKKYIGLEEFSPTPRVKQPTRTPDDETESKNTPQFGRQAVALL